MENEHEDFGAFRADGTYLAPHELREFRERNRLKKIEERLRKCTGSIIWLHSTLKLPSHIDLKEMMRKIETEGSASFYNEPRIIPKSGGGKRILISPKPDLKLVQKRIHQLLKATFKRPKNIFGYRGGNRLELIERHAGWNSILKFDIKDAFFQIPWWKIRRAIRNPFHGYRVKKQPQGFSASVARIIAKLCAYSPGHELVDKHFNQRITSFLAQGAPTSSICFDLAFKLLDDKLGRVAKRIGGVVSRFADNYYYSVKDPVFPKKLKRLIIGDVHTKTKLTIHKIRQANEGELCRILGYNLTAGKITNTRAFNRKLRGALYVLKTKLERGLPWKEAHDRVKGLISVSVNTPKGLEAMWNYCKILVKEWERFPLLRGQDSQTKPATSN